MNRNADLVQRSLNAVWHPCTQMKRHERWPLLPIARGQGVWLYDLEGKAYLDAISSWWVNLFGHAHPYINQALRTQLEQLEHVMLAGFTHEPVVQLSERLAAITPGQLGHAFYGSDGASATEIALKMSVHHWRNLGQPGKTGFLSLQNSYHGETIGALSVTDVALFRDQYAPLLRQTRQVPSPDWRLAAPGESARDHALRCAAEVGVYLEQHAASTAAIIVEPLVQGAAGMAMYHPVYLQQLRALCDTHEVHLIADEIAVGFGRTGTLFACEQAGIAPDLLCLSKGLTGGYLPLSVVLCTDTLYQAFYADEVARAFLHSHSYTGNPLACTAALATLDLFEQSPVLADNQRRATRLTELLQPVAQHPKVRQFRHLGMIWAFEVDTVQADFAAWWFERGLAAGVLLRPMGHTVYLMPPYVIQEEELVHLAQAVLQVLEQLPA